MSDATHPTSDTAPAGTPRRRLLRLLAWDLLAMSVLIQVAALPLSISVNRVIDGYLGAVGVALLFVSLFWVATGALIVSRQPGNWAGWLFCFIGMALSFSSFIQAYAIYGLRVSPGSLPLVGLAAWLNEYVFLAVAFVPLLFILFPDGRLPSRRWRWAVVGLLCGMGIAFLASFVRAATFNNLRDFGIAYENPFGIESLGKAPGTAIAVGTILALSSGIACVFGLRARFKRATGEERQQMRWLVFVGTSAAVLLGLSIAFSFFGEVADLDTGPPIFPILGSLTALTIAFGVPGAFLVAILRYRLYDLDVVIRKTVIVGAMAAFIAVVYGGIVGGLGAIAGSRGGPTFSFLAAAVLAIAFQPARERARRMADRVVYGKRATPYEVLTEFAGRVGEAYESEEVLARMATILGEGTGAEQATIWLRIGDDYRAEATWPSDEKAAGSPPEDAVEVHHRGELLGALSVVMPPTDPMDPSKRALIGDLAAQAGLVLRNVKLIEELRASRQRLVAAQDEERRKLERNLHDGAQQQLVALSVQLKLVRSLVDRDPQKAGAMLDTVQGAAAGALEDLRDLARGIYPPLLADKGLPDAIAAQARRAAIPVEVEADGVGRYPQDVEAAVYFCTLEALNNVAKYAEASRAKVRLEQQDGHLEFEVSDDGRGFDTGTTGYGTGLQGMADRLDAIGGSLEVASAPGDGTTVKGRVPTEAER